MLLSQFAGCRAGNSRTLKAIWQTLMRDLVGQGIFAPEQRFGMHSTKRKGVTETGTKADKKAATRPAIAHRGAARRR